MEQQQKIVQSNWGNKAAEYVELLSSLQSACALK